LQNLLEKIYHFFNNNVVDKKRQQMIEAQDNLAIHAKPQRGAKEGFGILSAYLIAP